MVRLGWRVKEGLGEEGHASQVHREVHVTERTGLTSCITKGRRECGKPKESQKWHPGDQPSPKETEGS